MDVINESEHEHGSTEDTDHDATEENDIFFTFPQAKVKPIYSRFRISDGSRPARRPLFKLTPISAEKEDFIDAGYQSGNAPNTLPSDESGSSGYFCSVDKRTVTSVKNNAQVERNFKVQDNNKSNSEVSTPLQPYKTDLRTPFSLKSSLSLVKRVPKNTPTPCSQKTEENCAYLNNGCQEFAESDVNTIKPRIPCSEIRNKHCRVLKDILNQNHLIKKPECDRISIDGLPGIFETKGCLKTTNSTEDENIVSSKKSPKNKFALTPNVINKNFEGGGGSRFINSNDKNVCLKPKSRRCLLTSKEEGCHMDNFRNLRISQGIESNVIYVNNVQYSILSKLGQGGSSVVYLVLDRKSVLLAIKCVNLNDADKVTASSYLKEIDILSNLQDSNRVIKLIDHEYNRELQMLYVVMEKGDTDLSTLLKLISKTGDVSIFMVLYYWTEMLLAVKEIHTYGIVHADLKPANFLLVSGRLKLIDFGIASALQNDATSVYKSSMHGTCNYMSPEAIQDPGDASRTKVGYKSDVWSLGCILYNLLYHKTPFQHIVNNMKKLQVIVNPNHHIEFPPCDKCPTPLMEALKSCLNYDSKKRPSVEELLSINYLKG